MQKCPSCTDGLDGEPHIPGALPCTLAQRCTQGPRHHGASAVLRGNSVSDPTGSRDWQSVGR